MNKISIIALVVFVIIALYFLMSNGKDPKQMTGNVSHSGEMVKSGNYEINTGSSTIGWSAKKPLIDGYVNSGTFDIKGGSVTIDTKATSTGKVVIDMQSIKVSSTAKKPGKESMLLGHLKTKDFFDVEKYAESNFSINKIEEVDAVNHTYQVSGSLTMKDKTNNISFPMTLVLDNGVLKGDATFEIDRTKWGVNFGSGNFFQNLGDNLISDMVELRLSIVASLKTN
jgi:polyisoprenoid-binding protein YceI